MANCLLTPMILAKEFCLMLPSDAVVDALALGDKGIRISFESCGSIGSFDVERKDLTRSLNEVGEIYKPVLTNELHRIWANGQ